MSPYAAARCQNGGCPRLATVEFPRGKRICAICHAVFERMGMDARTPRLVGQWPRSAA